MLVYAPHYFQAFDKNEEVGLNATVVIVDKAYWDKCKGKIIISYKKI
jgi:hypothetical protein